MLWPLVHIGSLSGVLLQYDLPIATTEAQPARSHEASSSVIR
jgi:hypothetical protein